MGFGYFQGLDCFGHFFWFYFVCGFFFTIASIQQRSAICPGTFAIEHILEWMERSLDKEWKACPQTQSYSEFPKIKLC